jgi:apolipoprotein N-acyltransferase
LENGVVSESIDKMHLVPFVESRPIGTEQLLKAGLIPAAAVRNIVVGESVNYTSWENGDMRVVPCVCYDLFFSETFQRFPQRTKSINVCCLDETFDGNGVFRKLSRIHSRLRAVEFRQPVVRSSLGGFSGAFDQRGTSIEATEVHDKFSWFEVQPTNITTVYEEFGDWFPVFCCVVCSIFGIVSPFSSQNPQGKPQ